MRQGETLIIEKKIKKELIYQYISMLVDTSCMWGEHAYQNPPGVRVDHCLWCPVLTFVKAEDSLRVL